MLQMDRVEKLMHEHNITSKTDLEKACGLSNGALGKWASGAYKPSLGSLTKLAQYFGVTTDYLIGDSDDPAPPTVEPEDKITIFSRNARKLSPEDQEKLIDVARALFKKVFDDQE